MWSTNRNYLCCKLLRIKHAVYNTRVFLLKIYLSSFTLLIFPALGGHCTLLCWAIFCQKIEHAKYILIQCKNLFPWFLPPDHPHTASLVGKMAADGNDKMFFQLDKLVNFDLDQNNTPETATIPLCIAVRFNRYDFIHKLSEDPNWNSRIKPAMAGPATNSVNEMFLGCLKESIECIFPELFLDLLLTLHDFSEIDILSDFQNGRSILCHAARHANMSFLAILKHQNLIPKTFAEPISSVKNVLCHHLSQREWDVR